MEEAGDPRVTLIGTGHVFQISQAIHDAVLALRPDVVFVELDRARLRALLDRRAGKPMPEGGSWFHRRLQGFQEKIAASYGTEAGDEMLAAVDAAHTVGAKIALIDRPVDQTLRRALKELTIRERLRAVGMFAGGFLRSLLPGRRSARDQVDEEMAAYNQDPEAALNELAVSFPTIRRVVIDERDELMAKRIRMAMFDNRRGVAVVGDGHVPGMLRHLDDLAPEAFRLADIQSGNLPKPDPADTNNASFAFDVDQD